MLRRLLENSKVLPGVTHIAGSPNSGKTTLLYQLCRNLSKRKKALIFDCEMSFSAQRLREIIKGRDLLNNIIVIRITDKKQQFLNIMKIHNFLVNNSFHFIGINGFTNHFRFTEKNANEITIHQKLAMQMAYLMKVSKELKQPIVLTNQVSAFKEKGKLQFKSVAGQIVEHYSNTNIILQHVNKKLWKARNENEEIYYTLSSTGIEVISQK